LKIALKGYKILRDNENEHPPMADDSVNRSTVSETPWTAFESSLPRLRTI
jgi:hypothetical protein